MKGEQRAWPDGTVMKFLRPRELAVCIQWAYHLPVAMPIVLYFKAPKRK